MVGSTTNLSCVRAIAARHDWDFDRWRKFNPLEALNKVAHHQASRLGEGLDALRSLLYRLKSPQQGVCHAHNVQDGAPSAMVIRVVVYRSVVGVDISFSEQYWF